MAHTGNARPQGHQQVVGTKSVMQGPVYKWFGVFLSDDGLAAGDTNAIGNYGATTSSVPTHFWYEATEDTRIERMMVEIEDTSGMAAADYGNITGNLSEGIQIKHFAKDGVTELHDFTSQASIVSNADWAKYCYDVDIKTWGNGNDFLFVRWTFRRAGTPIRLQVGEHFAVLLHDDFSGLIQHKFLVQGYREKTFSHAH